MFCDQDLMWRSKLEERLMGLQLLDVKRPIHHRTLSTGSSFPSPTSSPNFYNQVPVHPFDRTSPDGIQGMYNWFCAFRSGGLGNFAS